jgi:hypothetical protein
VAEFAGKSNSEALSCLLSSEFEGVNDAVQRSLRSIWKARQRKQGPVHCCNGHT